MIIEVNTHHGCPSKLELISNAKRYLPIVSLIFVHFVEVLWCYSSMYVLIIY
jgi:hypothetical protein